MDEKEIKRLRQRYINGTISSEDEQRLELFESRVLSENLSKPHNAHQAKQQIIEKLTRRIKSDEQRGKWSSVLLKVAASVIIVFVLGGIVFNQNEKSVQDVPEEVWLTKTTPYGVKMNIELPDGTRVILNSGSSLKFPQSFRGDERRVELEGEAFFDVVKNANHPFIIHSDELETVVVGTSFNVKAFHELEDIVVSVLSGKVNVSAPSGTVSLVAGEQGIYTKQASKISKASVDITKVLYWKEGILSFEDMPLGEVADELERWYGIEISFQNVALTQCHLTATFQNESLSNILQSILHTKKEIHYNFQDNRHLVLSGRCTE